jgi:hypothetical protein
MEDVELLHIAESLTPIAPLKCIVPSHRVANLAQGKFQEIVEVRMTTQIVHQTSLNS